MFKKMLPVIAGLSTVRRYSMVAMTREESVLEHLGMVTLTCLLICRRLRLPAEDQAAILSRAILHDVDEVLLGDVARPTKHANAATKDVFHQLSGLAVGRLEKYICVDLGVAIEAKTGRLGSIVALADCLAVVYKVWDEILVRSNNSLVRQAVNSQAQIDALIERLHVESWQGEQLDVLTSLCLEAKTIAVQAELKATDGHNPFIEEIFINEA